MNIALRADYRPREVLPLVRLHRNLTTQPENLAYSIHYNTSKQSWGKPVIIWDGNKELMAVVPLPISADKNIVQLAVFADKEVSVFRGEDLELQRMGKGVAPKIDLSGYGNILDLKWNPKQKGIEQDGLVFISGGLEIKVCVINIKSLPFSSDCRLLLQGPINRREEKLYGNNSRDEFNVK